MYGEKGKKGQSSPFGRERKKGKFSSFIGKTSFFLLRWCRRGEIGHKGMKLLSQNPLRGKRAVARTFPHRTKRRFLI